MKKLVFIKFELHNPEYIKLNIFDVKGNFIRTLLKGSFQEGTYSILWDGRDEDGNLNPRGVYFYRLESSLSNLHIAPVLF